MLLTKIILPNLARYDKVVLVKRREYSIRIVFNEIWIKKVIIDPHFEIKHADSVNDDLILKLVSQLDGAKILPDFVKEPFSYFVDEINLKGKLYKMIWLLEKDQIYIGVVNVYRR